MSDVARKVAGEMREFGRGVVEADHNMRVSAETLRNIYQHIREWMDELDPPPKPKRLWVMDPLSQSPDQLVKWSREKPSEYYPWVVFVPRGGND